MGPRRLRPAAGQLRRLRMGAADGGVDGGGFGPGRRPPCGSAGRQPNPPGVRAGLLETADRVNVYGRFLDFCRNGIQNPYTRSVGGTRAGGTGRAGTPANADPPASGRTVPAGESGGAAGRERGRCPRKAPDAGAHRIRGRLPPSRAFTIVPERLKSRPEYPLSFAHRPIRFVVAGAGERRAAVHPLRTAVRTPAEPLPGERAETRLSVQEPAVFRRFVHHRPVSRGLSVGDVPPHEGGRQAARRARPCGASAELRHRDRGHGRRRHGRPHVDVSDRQRGGGGSGVSGLQVVPSVAVARRDLRDAPEARRAVSRDVPARGPFGNRGRQRRGD